MLMKYKPWKDNVNTLWDNCTEPKDQLLVDKYNAFIQDLAQQDEPPPDVLQKAAKCSNEVQDGMSNVEDVLMNDGDIEDCAKQSEWMEIGNMLGIDLLTIDPDDDDKCAIAWDTDYNPTRLEHTYEGRHKSVDNVSTYWQEKVLEAERELEIMEAPTIRLKKLQEQAVFMVEDLIYSNLEELNNPDGNHNGHLYMLICVGGTGKIETIKHI